MSESVTPVRASDNDLAVADVVAEISDRLQAGKKVDVEAYVARCPEAAERIRQLVQALDGLQALKAAPPSGCGPDEGLTGTLGDYRILREIGRGGMGVVYEAEQISLGRRVALKVLPFAAMMDPRHLQRFHNEARAAASLQHPNIVQVFAVGCERAVHFYAMQLIDGRTLADVIAARQAAEAASGGGSARETTAIAADMTEPWPGDAPPYRRVAELGVQAAEALEHAHRTGIVHRDVKPANLLIDGHGQLYVTDFGLARLGPDGGLTITGDLIGTLRYMAPEQVLAKHGLVDHRSDVYALGATLYELVTLRPAVKGRDREEVLFRIAFEEPAPLREIDRVAPEELGTILGKAMAKAPEDRYATAQDLADDLRRFLADRPILARPPSYGNRLRKWLRRHPWVVTSSLLALALVGGILACGSILIWQEQGHTRAALERVEEHQRAAEQRAEEAKRSRYVARLRSARQAWDSGDVLLARDVLSQCRPLPGEQDLRGWPWRHLWHRCSLSPGEAVTLVGHIDDVYAVTFSPDGRTVATAGKDGTARLWDATTGRLLRTLKGHLGDVNGVAFSPNGKTLATASDDRTVRLWDVATGRPWRVLRDHPHEVVGVAFTPNGQTIVSADRRALVMLWDAGTGAARDSFFHQHGDSLEAIALSPDGHKLVTSSKDGLAWVWDPYEKRKMAVMRSSNTLRAVAVSPDGKTVATGSMHSHNRWGARYCGVAGVWNAMTGNLLAELSGSADTVEAVAFSPDRRWLASGGTDGIVRVWDLATQKLLHAFRMQERANRVWALAFSPDGRTLAAARQAGTVMLCRPTPRDRKELTPPVAAGDLTFSPDGREVAGVARGGPWDRFLVRYSTESGLYSGNRSSPDPGDHGCRLPVYSPDGKKLAADGWGEIRCWDRDSGRVCLRVNTGGADYLGFTPDGRSILARVGRRPGEHSPFHLRLRRWDAESGQELPVPLPFDGEVFGAASTPDGRTFAISKTPGTVTYLHWPDTIGTTAPVSGIQALAPDGTAGAVIAASHTVEVYDLRSGERRARFRVGRGAVNQVAFSPDGVTLATGTDLGEVKLWDVPSGQEVLALEGYGRIMGLAFSPDGRVLGTSGLLLNGIPSTTLWFAPPERAAAE